MKTVSQTKYWKSWNTIKDASKTDYSEELEPLRMMWEEKSLSKKTR